MDFDLSADQLAMRDAAAALLGDHVTPERLRERVGPGTLVGTMSGTTEVADADDDPSSQASAGYDRSLWEAMAEQGWLAVERPEDAGGLGFGMVEVAVLCEQVGRHVAPAPFLQTVLTSDALGRAADSSIAATNGDLDPAVAKWVERLSNGEAVGAVSWSFGADRVAVSGSGPRLELTGTLDPVVYGPSADVVIVVTDDALYAVPLGDEQRPRPEPAMDRTREIGWLRLVGAPAWRIGDDAQAQRLQDRAATGIAAELLGSAERALEMSVEYAKERVQFGKPIGSFQAIKHKLADALVDVEGMRSTVYYAAWCTSVGHAESSLAASMAKAWCSDASKRVMAACLQVHGGIGFTWEHLLHLYFKRAQLDQVSFGDAAWHRDRIATLVRQRLAYGAGVF